MANIFQTFVITGGSSGMGLSLAILISSRGGSVCIVARNQSKLDLALEQVKAAASSPSQKFLSISADLTSHVAVRAAFDKIVSWNSGAPDVVWQCAGATMPGFFKNQTPEHLEHEIKTNYIGAMHTAHNAIRVMTEDSSRPADGQNRKIVFTASVLAFIPMAGYNSYTPAKAAMRALADGLRQECLLYDIDVSCCFPATIYSPGFEEEQKTKPELTKILEGADEGQTPEVVAQECVKGLERGEEMVVTAFISNILRSGSWGISPRNGVLDWLLGGLLATVMGVVGIYNNKAVKDYKKKVEKEGKIMKELVK